MAKTITFTMDDQTYAAAVDALCHNYGYSATVPDPANPGKTIPNSVTPDDFATAQVRNFVGENIRARQISLAADTARQQAAAAVDEALAKAVVTTEVK